VTRSPLFLAALASSAVPGLDPVAVEGAPSRPGDLFEIAYVHDSQDRRWVVKCPATPAAGAMLDDIAPLSGLLGRRLDVAMPMVRGFSPVPEGRAAVYLRVPGRPLDFAGLRPGGLAAEVGRTLAHIHNVEHLLFEEAGRPTYDADAHRRRQLSELDRAAATGHVPTGLLTRWEHALEDVSLWRFAPTAVHGTFIGQNVRASFDDEDDSSTGRVRGVLAWEESHIGDPADDFADLTRSASPKTLDAVLEAYAQSRVERPDVHLVRRARLAAEMAPLRTLLHALASGRLDVVERTADELRALESRVEGDDRRHAEEDAERSERTRLARERAEAVLDPDDPERPEPAWDATQPHTPFPMLGETQAISTTSLLDDPEPAATTGVVDGAGSADPEGYAAEPAPTATDRSAGPGSVDWAAPGARTSPAGGAPSGEAWPEPEQSQPVPLVAPDGGASPFEIDEVEALPDGVVDQHEGASDFVAVAHPEHRGDGHQG
jgi:aminoglycoside phosphotransferase (APT) family kinase protein